MRTDTICTNFCDESDDGRNILRKKLEDMKNKLHWKRCLIIKSCVITNSCLMSKTMFEGHWIEHLYKSDKYISNQILALITIGYRLSTHYINHCTINWDNQKSMIYEKICSAN